MRYYNIELNGQWIILLCISEKCVIIMHANIINNFLEVYLQYPKILSWPIACNVVSYL